MLGQKPRDFSVIDINIIKGHHKLDWVGVDIDFFQHSVCVPCPILGYVMCTSLMHHI